MLKSLCNTPFTNGKRFQSMSFLVEKFSTKSKTPQVDVSTPETSSDADKLSEEKDEHAMNGPGGLEWNGPQRGGKYPEPTRYGDWENKGRCYDF